MFYHLIIRIIHKLNHIECKLRFNVLRSVTGKSLTNNNQKEETPPPKKGLISWNLSFEAIYYLHTYIVLTNKIWTIKTTWQIVTVSVCGGFFFDFKWK